MTKRLSFVLGFKALIMIFLILFAGIGLGPDEAQYWTWSRHLDFGYYSKPPGIAWQIFLGTLAFGNSEFGVRVGALLIGTLIPIAMYRFGKSCDLSDRGAFYAALATALTPFGAFATFFAITDGGMLLFWILGCIEIAKGLETKELNSYKLGLWIACGALFKWPIFFLWIIALCAYPKIKILPGILLSLAGLLPSLYWNATHDFATFKHVSATAQGGSEGVAKGNPLEFFGAQAAIFSPVIFFLLLLSWARMNEVERPSQRFFGRVALLLFAAYMSYAVFTKVQGNWALFLYPPAFLYLAAYWIDIKNSAKYILWALVVSLLLLAAAFAIPTFQTIIPWKLNPFRHNVGWSALQDWIGKEKGERFLASDKYQLTSELSFYNPAQEQAYFLNLLGTRRNQFSYWPGPEKGKDALFFVVENGLGLAAKMEPLKEEYKSRLSPYFRAVGEPEWIPLVTSRGEVVKAALCYRCEEYNGMRPNEPEKY